MIAIRHDTKINEFIEFAPSTGWLILMLWPFAYQFPTFHAGSRALQLALIVMIFLMLFVADVFCFIKSKKIISALSDDVGWGWMILMGGGFLLPAVLHVYLMPSIPLVALIKDSGVSNVHLMAMRESAAKLLDVPFVVKYAFTWAYVIFAPIFIATAFWSGRWRLALLGLGTAGLYALTTLAKFPLMWVLSACAMALSILPTQFRKVLSSVLIGAVLTGVLGVCALLLSDALDFMRTSPSHIQPPMHNELKLDDPRRTLTYGDVARLEPREAGESRSRITNIASYIFYRAWLTPADVAHRWYQYFTYVEKEPLGLHKFFPNASGQEVAISREVGVWAYRERFPEKYGETISAYASFDADAFAHGGVWGVMFGTILLLIIRIGAALLRGGHPVGMAAYGVMLCGLAILPSSASLQAMLGAQGLFLVLLLLLVLRKQSGGDRVDL